MVSPRTAYQAGVSAIRALSQRTQPCDALTSRRIGEQTITKYGQALTGCSQEGILLSHFYMDWANLQYVPGTTRVRNFRNVRSAASLHSSDRNGGRDVE